MVYTVGFGKRNKPGVSTVRTNTAQEAIELAEGPERPGRLSRHAGGEMACSSFGFLIV
jgi:hypothetical protein